MTAHKGNQKQGSVYRGSARVKRAYRFDAGLYPQSSSQCQQAVQYGGDVFVRFACRTAVLDGCRCWSRRRRRDIYFLSRE